MDNESLTRPYGDTKGKQIFRLATFKKLTCLGPPFKAFVTVL